MIRSAVAQIIGKPQTISSLNRLSTAATELRPGRITAAARSAKHFDGLWRTPVERRGSDRNPTASAKSCTGGITVTAAWTRDSGWFGSARRAQRCGVNLSRDWLKRRVSAPATKLHSFSETRVTLGAHHDDERRRVYPMLTVETSAARGSQLIV